MAVARSGLGQAVDMRGSGDRISVTPQVEPVVLAGDPEDVGAILGYEGAAATQPDENDRRRL